MKKTVETDIVIIGGGIAGLWLLNRVRQLGFSTILLESNALGSGQTGKSQGIIHGGMKYALQGALTSATQSIADMPTVWRHCLQGKGDIDLSDVPVLSQKQYLWTTDRLFGKISGFFASQLLKEKITEVEQLAYPDIFKDPQFKGQVYALPEIVIDIPALIRALVKPNQDVIFKVNPFDHHVLQFDEQDRLQQLKVRSPLDEVVTIEAQRFIFTSGAGNELLLKQLKNPSVAMQRRPLHMVLMKTDFSYPLYAHCLGMSATPRITITTHRTHDGKTVWYLGGQLAEEGVKRDAEMQIQFAKKELAELFPWLDFSLAQFATFSIDRAESLQPGGKRPDHAFLKEIENMIIAWPTKLAMAPKLADDIIQCLQRANISPASYDLREMRAWPMPMLAMPVWDELL